MATQSTIFAWRIPWTEEPGGHSPWGLRESDMTEVFQHAHMQIPFKLCYMYNWNYIFNIFWLCKFYCTKLSFFMFFFPGAYRYLKMKVWITLTVLLNISLALPPYSLGNMLVSCGCCKKFLHTCWLKTTQICCLAVLEVSSLRSVSLGQSQGVSFIPSGSSWEHVFPSLFQHPEAPADFGAWPPAAITSAPRAHHHSPASLL